MCTVNNNIGDEGAKVLGEALKHNNGLTTLDLAGIVYFNDCVKQTDPVIPMCEQRIILVMKELKYWEKY